MKNFEVGDLVHDVLNTGDGSYGLGVVVTCGSDGNLADGHPPIYRPLPEREEKDGLRYDVYFNKFERIITFHGDYLEKV